MPKPKVIALVAMPNVQLLDVSGPLDVFAEANVQAGKEVYQLRIVATVPGDIRSSSGVRLVPDQVIGQRTDEKVDTLLIAGAPNAPDAALKATTAQWLRKTLPGLRRYGSVCT